MLEKIPPKYEFIRQRFYLNRNSLNWAVLVIILFNVSEMFLRVLFGFENTFLMYLAISVVIIVLILIINDFFQYIKVLIFENTITVIRRNNSKTFDLADISKIEAFKILGKVYLMKIHLKDNSIVLLEGLKKMDVIFELLNGKGTLKSSDIYDE